MTTITGKIESASGETLHATMHFISLSTPQFPPTIVQVNTDKRVLSGAADGLFSVQLAAGNYRVSVRAKNLETVFTIAVPDGDETISIEDLVTSTVSSLPGLAPYTVWNGVRAGHITFSPIAAPPAPEISVVDYAGGHITEEHYRYAISYVTQEGETELSPYAELDGGADADKANRVTLEVNPSRVITKRIWRNRTSGVPGASDPSNMWLLAEVAPEVAYYDDWESTEDFYARATRPPALPDFNTTAGIINASADNPILFFSVNGLKLFAKVIATDDIYLADTKSVHFGRALGQVDGFGSLKYVAADQRLEMRITGEGENDRLALSLKYDVALDAAVSQFSGQLQHGERFTVANVGVPDVVIVSGGNYPNEGYQHEYKIYAYKNVVSGRVYSPVAAYCTITDDGNFDDNYNLTVSWEAVAGADGYRVLKQDGYNGYSFDVGQDIAATSFDDDGSGWTNADGAAVVTPAGAGLNFAITPDGQVQLPGDDGNLYKISVAVVDGVPTLRASPI